MIKRRLLAMIMAFIIVLGVCAPGAAAADDATVVQPGASDNQTATLGWEGWTPISTETQLRAIDNAPNEKYYLTGNIALSSAWTPLGVREAFRGTLDGNGYTISGVTFPSSATGIAHGFFANNYGTIRNLKLSVDIDRTLPASSDSVEFGALAGVNLGLIINCTVSGTMDISYGSAGAFGQGISVGAIAGYNGGTIKLCKSSLKITVADLTKSDDAVMEIGGICGLSYDDITYCENSGAVTATGNMTEVGGIVGRTSASVIVCSNTGSVTGSSYVDAASYSGNSLNGYADVSAGGLVGYAAGSGEAISASSNTGAVKCNSAYWGYVGGSIGYIGGEYALSQCSNTGNITGTSYSKKGTSRLSIGGLVGGTETDGSTLTNCYNVGALAADAYNSASGYICSAPEIGGLVGYADEMEFTNCFNKGYAALRPANAYSNYWIGGIVGRDAFRSSYPCTYTNTYWPYYGYMSGIDQRPAGSSTNTTGQFATSWFATQSRYKNYDFTNTWVMGSAHPVLRNTAPHTHSYQTLTPQDPTCTQKGLADAWYCAGCSSYFAVKGTRYIYSDERELPMLGHTSGTPVRVNVVEATCKQAGSYDEVVYCSVCRTKLSTTHKIIEKSNNHVPKTDVAVPPTCTTDGKTEGSHCLLCGEVLVAQTDIPKYGHAPLTDAAVPPTCTEKGKTEGSHCSVCSEVLVSQTDVPETGHSPETDAAVPPTCTEKGKTEGSHCSVCSEVLVSQTDVPETGHSPETDAAVPPTCTEKGKTEGSHCSVCGDILVAQTDIPENGHSWDGGVLTREPTPTEDGELTYTCTVCGETNTEPVKYVAPRVYRIFGDSRFETAYGVADVMREELGAEKFDSIIVASGMGFADALAGSYLAAKKNAPIILTYEANTDEVKTYIKENLASGGTVYLLGGTAVVPQSMESGLDGFTVKRLYGDNRYDTNLAILAEAGVSGEDVLVCTGTGFADSLSASATGLPILLVGDALTDGQKTFLSGDIGDIYIIGGSSVVSTSAENALKAYGNVDRLGGSSRFETSVMVAKRFFDEPQAAVLAYALNFPDGLCGGALAYAIGAPLILTATDYEQTAVDYAAQTDIRDGYVLGGSGLISDGATAKIFALPNGYVIEAK